MPRLWNSPYFHVPFNLEPLLLMGSKRKGLRDEPCSRAAGATLAPGTRPGADAHPAVAQRRPLSETTRAVSK